MKSKVKIGIIGDYDGRPSHLATEEALRHSAEKLELTVEYQWLPTDSMDQKEQELYNYDGFWCAPSSVRRGILKLIRLPEHIKFMAPLR